MIPKEHPILFSTPMVQAILEGRKTMTRRIVKPQPTENEHRKVGVIDRRYGDESGLYYTWLDRTKDGKGKLCDDYNPETWKCPYGMIGDRLWVRETWRESGNFQLADNSIPKIGDVSQIIYKADNNEPLDTKWRPSIFMPRFASRITLEITKVRVERLQEISRGDCMQEGCPFPNIAKETNPKKWYMDLWESIHGKNSWAENPWVWVIEFRRIK